MVINAQRILFFVGFHCLALMCCAQDTITMNDVKVIKAKSEITVERYLNNLLNTISYTSPRVLKIVTNGYFWMVRLPLLMILAVQITQIPQILPTYPWLNIWMLLIPIMERVIQIPYTSVMSELPLLKEAKRIFI